MTAADWIDAITRALHARDVEGVAAMVGAMAINYPHEAESVRQILLAASTSQAQK